MYVSFFIDFFNRFSCFSSTLCLSNLYVCVYDAGEMWENESANSQQSAA